MHTKRRHPERKSILSRLTRLPSEAVANNTQDSSIRPAGKRRLLLVDDDRGITATLSSILQEHDFEVTIASTVAEAVAAINADPFDVLISDLNIHQAADGFTIINEMRRLQPEAVTIVLTGFPAYASALKAISIHERVDDFHKASGRTDSPQ
jgi:ActR/RegA family two-component response regulator